MRAQARHEWEGSYTIFSGGVGWLADQDRPSGKTTGQIADLNWQVWYVSASMMFPRYAELFIIFSCVPRPPPRKK